MDNNTLTAMGTLGVIFTDTCVLADKYNCRQEEVLQLIRAFICGSEGQGVEWQLVDVGGDSFDYIFSNDVTWRGYCRALSDYCAGMGWQTNCQTPLMILGGDDVIPIPLERIPPSEKDRPVDLQTDLYYGYPPTFQLLDEVVSALENDCSLYDYMMERALFNVSRLPLENGDIQTSLQQDLGSYFSRSIETGGFIKVESLLPTSAYNWYMSVRGITENLPLLSLGADNRCWLSDIIISPNHSMGDGPALHSYVSALEKADMLLFNTHGSNDPDISGFLGQGPAPEPGDEQIGYVERPLAFDVELLPYCKAKILNTLACFGARYDKYQRKKSMLLSAIYGGFLLYMGSCEIALGRGGVKDPANRLRLTGYSETLMKTYINLLMNGKPAGLALLEAKWRYLDDCIEEDSAITALYTVLEFNQFGNPALKVMAPRYNRQKGCQNVLKSSHKNIPSLKLPSQKFSTFLSTGISELDDLYLDVRNTLDNALLQLSEELGEMLEKEYCYCKKDLLLKQVVRIDEPRNFGDRLFHYDYGRIKNGEHIVIVRVDKNGKPKDVIHTI